MVVQPAMLYGMETLPLTYSSHVKKLETMTSGRELKYREHHIEIQENKIEVVWIRQEVRPRIRRKKDSGDGTTWEENSRKTEAEIDGNQSETGVNCLGLPSSLNKCNA